MFVDPEPQRELAPASTLLSKLSEHNLLVKFVILVQLLGAFSIAVGTFLGLTAFTDAGYPDSATLLRVIEFVRSGRIYPDINLPPYLVTIYGPLTYTLLSMPYRLALVLGVTPEILMRLFIVAAFSLCVFLVFLISRRFYGAGSVAWVCVLFAVSSLPLARWTTQLRGDFLALAFALLSLYLVLAAKDYRLISAAGLCAGMAPLVKQTFLAAPVAILGWLIFRRRYKEAVLWSACFAVTLLGGYAFFCWREPLMLQHIAALRHPVLEYRTALGISWYAASQPVVIFGIIGGFLAVWKRSPEHLLILAYWVVAWLVAMFTSFQVGGNINYFWEPLLLSSVLAGPALLELQRTTHRSSILVTVSLLVILIKLFLPALGYDFQYLQRYHTELSERQLHKARWESFVAVISGKRLLSTMPAVTILSSLPEMPDSYLSSTVELRGGWSSLPLVAEVDSEVFDLIVIGKPDTWTPGSYRGVPYLSKPISDAVSKNYDLTCIFEDMEVWVPHRRSSPLLPRLYAIGCQPAPSQGSPLS